MSSPGHNELVNKFNEMIDRYNRLVRNYNQYAMPPQPVGRPYRRQRSTAGASAQLRKRGLSLRGIADEMSLGLPRPCAPS